MVIKNNKNTSATSVLKHTRSRHIKSSRRTCDNVDTDNNVGSKQKYHRESKQSLSDLPSCDAGKEQVRTKVKKEWKDQDMQIYQDKLFRHIGKTTKS